MSPGEDSEEDTSLFNYVFMMKILVNFATNIVIIYVHGLWDSWHFYLGIFVTGCSLDQNNRPRPLVNATPFGFLNYEQSY